MDTEVALGTGVAIGLGGAYVWAKTKPKIRKLVKAVKWLIDTSTKEENGKDA